jgi:SAM-dependent methyltransferase
MMPSPLPVRACPVCGHPEAAVLAELTYALFDDLDLPGTKALKGCAACGMMYDDVAFSAGRLEEYYRRNDHYVFSSDGGGGGDSEDDRARYDRILDAVAPSPSGLIVDYGCGPGGFVVRCRQRGLSAVGIEPSARCRRAAQDQGLEVYASLEALAGRGRPRRIQAVTLSHVLEHLLDPLNVLRRLARVAPGAQVYIEVPDAAAYLRPDGVRWPELYFEHLCHFRRDDLGRLAERSGIAVAAEGTAPFSTALSESRCLFLLGRVSQRARETVADPGRIVSRSHALPPLSVGLPPDGKSASLWGVSQYAMLLLGSVPEIARRVTRLFDASPAKVGRRIRGMVVEPAAELASLTRDDRLLVPRSKFLQQMQAELHRMKFSGAVQVI